MVDENRSYLLGKDAFALQDRLGHFGQMREDAFALQDRLGHFDQRWEDASALQDRLGHFDQRWEDASALQDRLGHFDQIENQIEKDAFALQDRLGHFGQMREDAFALQDRLGHFDQIEKDAFALQDRLGHFGQMREDAFALQDRLGHFDQIEKDAFALQDRLDHFGQMREDAFALQDRLGHFDQMEKHASANMESLMKFEQDWQKRVNFLSETQASLGFPDIIRGKLAVDPFRISTPTQRRTPLLDLPPTASAGEVYEEIFPEIIPVPSPELVPITNQEKVFIVHGHDHPARDAVAEFVNNWGLTATILDKEPNKGRTIIEKFEDLADEASFAIVLFTPDDVGASVKDKVNLKPRARQNVILELGYFLKAVGRQQICILHKGDIELPSDIQGVVYVPMDDNGEWKQAIVREMESIGLLVDGNEI